MRQATRRASYGAVALRALAFLVLVMLAAAVTVAQQRGAGAYLAELSATDAQEARHFVAGLMLKDHVAAGLPAFAGFREAWSLHYPIAPEASGLSLLHVVEAGWYGVLGTSTPAALLLPALLAALLAVSAGWAAMRAAGVLPGIAVGFVVSALPLLRQAFIGIGTALPLALCGLLAALAFARFMRRGAGVDAALFALAGGAAVMTAPEGVAVVAVPPLAVLVAGRFDRLGRPAFWIPLAILAGLAGGRMLLTGAPTLAPTDTLLAHAAVVRATFGTFTLALAAVGVLFAVVAGWRRQQGGDIMAATTALLLGMVGVLACAGRDVRADAMLPLLAPLVMLSAFGAIRLIGLFTSGWPAIAGLAVAFLMLLAAMPALLEPVRKGGIGMDEAAQAVLAREGGGSVIVAAADPAGEAALVAAVAQHDPARRHFVFPARRLPSGDAAALLRALEAMGAPALVVETTPAAQSIPGNGAIAALIAAEPGRFRRIAGFPRADGKGAAVLYAFSGGSPPPDTAATLRRIGATDR